jgi:hypothetical protein
MVSGQKRPLTVDGFELRIHELEGRATPFRRAHRGGPRDVDEGLEVGGGRDRPPGGPVQDQRRDGGYRTRSEPFVVALGFAKDYRV